MPIAWSKSGEGGTDRMKKVFGVLGAAVFGGEFSLLRGPAITRICGYGDGLGFTGDVGECATSIAYEMWCTCDVHRMPFEVLHRLGKRHLLHSACDIDGECPLGY
jgi:hypothetical protein